VKAINEGKNTNALNNTFSLRSSLLSHCDQGSHQIRKNTSGGKNKKVINKNWEA